MTELTGKSGANIVINAAPWKDAKELKRAIEQQVSLNGIDITKETDIASLLLRIDGSDLVENALWPCLIRCTRNDEKITMQTFDSLEARKDYYEIVIACVKENLSPLVESLFLQFAGLLATKNLGDSPKSE